MPWSCVPEEIRIVYSGAVYAANADAIRNVVQAIELIPRPAVVRMHLYTAQTPTGLARNGISGPVVCHPHETPAAMSLIQRCADILLLPLAFESPYPEVIRTSSPGKLGEYLAAGRPVLAHVPRDSFVGWYFREHDVGPIIDADSPELLARALRHVMDDSDARAQWCTRALKRARVDFDLETARSRFLRLFE